MLWSAFLPCFAGLNNAEKESLPSKEKARVRHYAGIQWTPTKCDENEGKTVLEETEPSKENRQSWSSALSSDPNSIGLADKGPSASELDLYSDDEATINSTAVSLETKSAPLSDIETNNQLVLNSGNTGLAFQQKESSYLNRRNIYTHTNAVRQTLPKQKEPPAKDDLHSCSSSLSIDANSTCVVDKGRQVSVLERYSDDSESKDTSREGITLSVASLETRSAYLSETKAKSVPFGKLDENLPRSDRADKTIRSWLTDPRLYMVSARRDQNCLQDQFMSS